MEAAVISTGGTWERFLIVSKSGSDHLYWNGANWVPRQRNALLYADRAMAEKDLERLKATR
jgi:hypothetical protein